MPRRIRCKTSVPQDFRFCSSRKSYGCGCFWGTQLIEQVLGIRQVGGVETLGEPVVDFRENHARFVAAAGIAQQAREARSRAQLICFRTHTTRQRECCAEVCLGCFAPPLLRLQLATQAKCVGPIYVGVRTIWPQDLFDRVKCVANGARQRLGLCQDKGEEVAMRPYRG